MSERFARWEGDYLRVPPYGFIQTSHCAVCARPGPQITELPTHSLSPLRVLLPLLLCGWLGPIILLVTLSRRLPQIEVPLCLDCDDRWLKVSRSFRSFAFLGALGIPLAFHLLWERIRPGPISDLIPGAIVGLIAWGWGLLALYALRVRRHHLVCVKSDARGTLLRVPNATLLQTAWQEDAPPDPVTRPA